MSWIKQLLGINDLFYVVGVLIFLILIAAIGFTMARGGL